MTQVPRSSSSSFLSDDPLENVTGWLQANQKPVVTAISVLALSAAAIMGYRWMQASERVKASRALAQAVVPFGDGNLPAAQAQLAVVAKNYSGSAVGAQAAMMLSQVLYEQKQYAEGVAALEPVRSSAGSIFLASIESLISVGYEAQGKFEQAAEHYGKAADAAQYPLEQGGHRANQARMLTAAGKVAEARAVWVALSKNEDLPFAQEAQVRIGELAGSGK